MSLSKRTKDILVVSMADKKSANELSAAVDSLHAVAPAAHVAPLGVTSNIPTSNVTLSTSDTYTDAAVKTAIDAAANAIRVAAEARVDAIEAKVDAIIAALIAAGLMS